MVNKNTKNASNISLNRSKKLTFFFFALPGVLLYSTFFIFPVGLGIYYSFTDWDGITRKYDFIGFTNYLDIFKDERFLKALMFNVIYCVLLTIAIVGRGKILAVLLNSQIKGITFFRAMYFVPAVLSMVTIGLIFNQIYYRAIPPIGQALGIEFLSQSILSSPDTAVYGILFVNVWQGVATPTLLFLAGLMTVPLELYEAAQLDGANAFSKFRFITLPFLMPVLSVVMVLTVKAGLGVFDYVETMTEGGPAGATESLSMLIYSNAFIESKYAYAVSEAIVVGIIIAVISAVQISITNKKRV